MKFLVPCLPAGKLRETPGEFLFGTVLGAGVTLAQSVLRRCSFQGWQSPHSLNMLRLAYWKLETPLETNLPLVIISPPAQRFKRFILNKRLFFPPRHAGG